MSLTCVYSIDVIHQLNLFDMNISILTKISLVLYIGFIGIKYLLRRNINQSIYLLLE